MDRRKFIRTATATTVALGSTSLFATPGATTSKPAILPVQLGGNVSDMDKILAVAGRHKIPVVEDACQAHLAEWKKRMVGSWGLCGCFSNCQSLRD